MLHFCSLLPRHQCTYRYGYIYNYFSVCQLCFNDYHNYIVHVSVLYMYRYNYVCTILLYSFQVITRFVCSSSPIVFWFSSFQFINNTRTPVRVPVQVSRVLSDLSLTAFRHYGSVQLIVLYCLVYVLLGFMLHCNFLPWT